MKRRRPPAKQRAPEQPSVGAVASTGASSPAPPPALWLGSIALVAALCCVSYCNTLENAFSFDDNFAVVKNPDVVAGSPLSVLLAHDFWGRDILDPLSHKSWRPLTTLTFRWNFLLAGLEVQTYHAINLAAHTAASIALLAFVHQASGGLGGGGLLGCGSITACLFAVHPVQ
jgi:hypothetical protein